MTNREAIKSIYEECAGYAKPCVDLKVFELVEAALDKAIDEERRKQLSEIVRGNFHGGKDNA